MQTATFTNPLPPLYDPPPGTTLPEFSLNYVAWSQSELIRTDQDAKRSARTPHRHYHGQDEPLAAKRAKRDEANLRAAGTLLEHVETTGVCVATPPGPDRNTTRQAQAALLWQGAESTRARDRAAQVFECGASLWVAVGPDGPVLIRERCKLRICPNCREWRGHQITTACEALMETWSKTKFITLTRKPRDLTLRETVRTLVRDFNRLRRTALWKASATQGIYVVEVTRHKLRHHFHVHLHVLCESTYIPHAALSAAWKRITGDSENVWIAAGTEGRARYMGKYAGKGFDPTLCDFERWAFWDELVGCRLAATFGGAPSIASLQRDPEHTLIAPLADVQRWAANGDEWAQGLLTAIFEKIVTAERAADRPPPLGISP